MAVKTMQWALAGLALSGSAWAQTNTVLPADAVPEKNAVPAVTKASAANNANAEQPSRAAQPAAQKVTVSGAAEDAARDFAAAKVIIGRTQIRDSGLQNVNELLKREPAITVGKDGRLGLLGLPGYTQILIDGLPPAGRDINNIDLSEVERIEIIKSSTAETGPFGIAGTINVVLRKLVRQQRQTVSAQTGLNGSSAEFSGAWNLSQSDPESPFSTNLHLSSSQKDKRSNSAEQQTLNAGGLVLPQYQAQRYRWERYQTVAMAFELVRRLEHGSLSLKPGAGGLRNQTETQASRQWNSGGSLLTHSRSRWEMSSIQLPLNWQYEDEDWGESELNLRRSLMRSSDNSQRNDISAGTSGNAISGLREDSSEELSNSWLIAFTQRKTFSGGHRVRAGLQLEQDFKTPEKSYRYNGLADSSLAALGMQYSHWEQKRRVFIQDDWRADPLLAVNAGVSVAEQRSEGQEVSGNTSVSFRVVSPSLHIAKKLAGNPKQQFRLSLARSFKEVETDTLLMHPSVNSLAPCTPGAACGANTIDTPDSTGNPNLRPEKALALNLSYEHPLQGDSKLTLEAYTRQIQGKTGTELVQMPVSWASVPRWVQRPANLGDADVTGVNLEWRLSAKDWLQDAPKLDVRGSAGWARSELKDWPGPDNRVDGSLPWRAKLGMTYQLAAAPVKLDMNASWQPGDWLRNNLNRRTYSSHQTTLDASAAWTINPRAKLVLNMSGLLRQDSNRISRYETSAGTLDTRTVTDGNMRVSLRGEFSL